MSQGHTFKLGVDVGHLCLVRLQEFAACGYVEEKVSHDEVGAYRTSREFLRTHFAAFDAQASAHFVFRPARVEFHLSHGGNRGERFTTKSHSLQMVEVLGRTDFRCGVALESQTGIGG